MVEDILHDAPVRTYEGFQKHEKDIRNLVASLADLTMLNIKEEYQPLALQRADNGEPLEYGVRRNAHLA